MSDDKYSVDTEDLVPSEYQANPVPAMPDDPVLYLLMRSDIPSMNPGKLAAQAAHVACAFLHHVHTDSPDLVFQQWYQQTSQGFGTKICLAADKAEIEEITSKATIEGLITGVVYDPSYPYEIKNSEVAEVMRSMLVVIDKLNPPSLNRLIHGWEVIDIGDGRFLGLRRELVGGYVFANRKVHQTALMNTGLGELSLYP